MRIAIVDDELTQRDLLSRVIVEFCKKNKEACELFCFANGIDFLTDYPSGLDCVFLDIQMNLMDGMTVAKKLREKDSEVLIIFVTNMAQYAIEGYQVNALDFIVKPISEYGIEMEMQKILKISRLKKEDHLWVTEGSNMVRLSYSQLVYVEIVKHNVVLHTTTGELSFRGTLKELAPKLSSARFSRPNNCYIVNMSYIKEVVKDSIILENGEELLISRPRKKQFMMDMSAFISRMGV